MKSIHYKIKVLHLWELNTFLNKIHYEIKNELQELNKKL